MKICPFFWFIVTIWVASACKLISETERSSIALWHGLRAESLFDVVEGMLTCKQEKHAPQ